MKQISVEEIMAAYKKTGLRPIKNTFRRGENAACPLSAFADSLGFNPANRDSVHETEFLVSLGYDYGYLNDLTLGVDCGRGSCLSGVVDGAKIREALHLDEA